MIHRKLGLSISSFFLAASLSISLVGSLSAGTTGSLSGRITDNKKQPLPGVTVLVLGTRLGANSDADGRYNVLNLPAGKYQVKVQMIGYRPVVVTDVTVSADYATKLDVKMEESPVEMKEVVVSGKSPVVDIRKTSNVATVGRDQIANLPVQELQDVVNLQAGVVDGHFRGGRLDEVQFQVDGVSVNNAYDNRTTLRIDRSLIEEVQVISGTFDAEYGQAMSGVVNAVLRRGSERLEWDTEAFSGGFFYPEDESARRLEFNIHPVGIQNYQASASGPTGLPGTLFLASLRRYLFDDFVYGTRFFLPTDNNAPRIDTLRASGDSKEVPLGFSREWSGVGKISNRALKDIEVSYQAIFNVLDGRRINWAFRYNPDGLSRQHTYSIVHGLDWTHTLSKKTFYNLSVRQNYFNYEDKAFDDLWDPRYDAANAPRSIPGFLDGATVGGVELTRFHQNTNAIVLKGSLVSQVTRDHQAKLGAEFQFPRLEFGNLGYLVKTTQDGRPVLLRKENQPPDYPGLSVYHPVQGAAFAQEQGEWNDLSFRAGLRLDYFDARSTLPGDPANPANAIAGIPPAAPRSTTRKVSLSPRLGVSYPVTDRSSVYFAYGHFYQLPALGDIFSNADFSSLANLAAGGIQYSVFGNPDIKPEKTVQYQAGYKQAITDDVGADLTVFYKDIRDLLGTEFISTYNDAEYARLTNADFGNVLGITAAFTMRPRGLLGGALDYTWQRAQGNASEPRETATAAAAGKDARPRLLPLNWDQRHTLNVTATLARPGNFSASAILRVASGQPYTPSTPSGFGGAPDENSGRKPTGVLLDLRAEKSVPSSRFGIHLFGRIFNALDTRFFNGFVFADTGSPFYSSTPQTDRSVLDNPGRFYAPRRIEVGVRLSPRSEGT